MNKIGKIAAVLAISASAAAIGGTASPALADGHPIIDIIDDAVPNANVLPNLLANLSVSPTVICIPTAQSTNSVHGNNNQTTTNQTNNCTQSAQQTPPPSNGGFSGYETTPVQSDQCAPGEFCAVTVPCPDGKNLISGSYLAEPPGQAVNLSSSNVEGTSYFVSFRNMSMVEGSLRAFATCADVTP